MVTRAKKEIVLGIKRGTEGQAGRNRKVTKLHGMLETCVKIQQWALTPIQTASKVLCTQCFSAISSLPMLISSSMYKLKRPSHCPVSWESVLEQPQTQLCPEDNQAPPYVQSSSLLIVTWACIQPPFQPYSSNRAAPIPKVLLVSELCILCKDYASFSVPLHSQHPTPCTCMPAALWT